MPQQLILRINPEQLLQLTEDDAIEVLHEEMIADDEDEEAGGQQQDDAAEDEGEGQTRGTRAGWMLAGMQKRRMRIPWRPSWGCLGLTGQPCRESDGE
jgi:hypothetical protein